MFLFTVNHFGKNKGIVKYHTSKSGKGKHRKAPTRTTLWCSGREGVKHL